MDPLQAKEAKEAIKEAQDSVIKAAKGSKGELREHLTDAEFALEKAEAEVIEQKEDAQSRPKIM